MIAENELALGEIVELISHSPIWERSLILVVEDGSQDGADHVDAHRIPAFAIGRYAKRGAVIHRRYDFLSFIRTLEMIVGMKPLNLFDGTAVPLYDAFDPDPSDNAEPYRASPRTSISSSPTPPRRRIPGYPSGCRSSSPAAPRSGSSIGSSGSPSTAPDPRPRRRVRTLYEKLREIAKGIAEEEAGE
jgi:hypothetical protein